MVKGYSLTDYNCSISIPSFLKSKVCEFLPNPQGELIPITSTFWPEGIMMNGPLAKRISPSTTEVPIRQMPYRVMS